MLFSNSVLRKVTLLMATLGGIYPEGSFPSPCGLFSAQSRSSHLKHKHTQNSQAPTPCKRTWESEDGKEEENVYNPGDGHRAISIPLSRAQNTRKCYKTSEECLVMCPTYTAAQVLVKGTQCQHECTGTGMLQ